MDHSKSSKLFQEEEEDAWSLLLTGHIYYGFKIVRFMCCSYYQMLPVVTAETLGSLIVP